jgi:hypothetical protein
VLETIVKPDENMREQLSAIAMKTEEKQVPFLGELSKGRHTVDMQPQPQSKAQEIDDDGELEPVSPGDAAIAERGDPTS